MKHKKLIKKVLTFLTLPITISTISATTILLINSNKTSQTTNNNFIINKAFNNIDNNYSNIDFESTINQYELNKKFSTIDGQEIVNAINSYNTNNSLNNINNAFGFIQYEQENAISALIRTVQENIKYYSNNISDTNIYTLPTNAIQITFNKVSYSYNVFIDLSFVNGFVNYYNNFNPSLFDQNQITLNNNNLISVQNKLSFNAIVSNNQNIKLTQSENKNLNILYFCLIIMAILITSSILFWLIKRKWSNKKIY